MITTDDPRDDFLAALPFLIRDAAISHDSLSSSHAHHATILRQWEAALVRFLKAEWGR